MIAEITAATGGIVYQRRNDTGLTLDCLYAAITSRVIVRCAIDIDGVLVDVVYAGAGGSHSWWCYAGGKLLPNGLKPGATLTVTLDGPGAFRLDWM